jgi:hypothetical protein
VFHERIAGRGASRRSYRLGAAVSLLRTLIALERRSIDDPQLPRTGESDHAAPLQRRESSADGLYRYREIIGDVVARHR